ncbi:hypothetical protein [Rothia amarae]|uniref:hypothetical protein n=1 Tax=Rothia amarae TaxID=169480 RepID=UPI001247753A
MSASLTRRQIAKGAAWAAPAVIATAAVPAYSASAKYVYYTSKSVSGDYRHTGCTLTSFQYTTATPVGIEVAGFAIGHLTDNTAANTTATLSDLTFTLALPKGMVSGLTVNNSLWKLSGPTGATTISTKAGTVNTSNMDVYVLTFAGSLTNKVTGESSTTTWPGTTFTLSASSGSYCYSSATIYSGYSFRTGTLANNQFSWNNYTNVENTSINPAG